MRKGVILHSLSRDLQIQGLERNVKNQGYSASTDGSKQEVNAPVFEGDKLQGGKSTSNLLSGKAKFVTSDTKHKNRHTHNFHCHTMIKFLTQGKITAILYYFL